MKLQKLLYYCQAWALVWDEEPLFSESIEAWANGPVIAEFYEWHQGMFYIDKSPYQGDLTKLDENQKDTVDQVLKAYGSKTAQWLSDLTHLEEPWKNARKGLDIGQRGSNVIDHASLYEYYGTLDKKENMLDVEEEEIHINLLLNTRKLSQIK